MWVVAGLGLSGQGGCRLLRGRVTREPLGPLARCSSWDLSTDTSVAHTGLDHLALSVPVNELPDWEHRLNQAGVEHSPPALSALGEPLIVLRDPDHIQLQIYGIHPPE